ncbi:TPA: DUF4145 domain-containing protein [Salmonella enterica subsp. salamae serovar 28:r:e,n,z15]|nr:DUF4145 domain-containing protein [Salmonella enterica subsp. salamae serovar 28:r:e,n,z15]
MFITLSSSCPHCLRERAFMYCIHNVKKREEHHYSLVFKCRSCEKLTIAEVEDLSKSGKTPESRAGECVIPDDGPYRLCSLYPEPAIISAPEYTPGTCARFFIEARDNLVRQRYETAVMLCRKVMDIATSYIESGENSTSLAKRLYLLKEQSRITPEMADWAKIIRLDGNVSAHSDENFTEQEAREIISFTETFLLYAFTLPGMVKQWHRE